MAIEHIIQAVLAASPAKRAKVAAVLNGTDSPTKSNEKRETRLVTISGAAKMLALGRNTIYRLIETKRLDTVDLNGCRRITVKSINEFLDGERPPNAATERLIGASKTRHATNTPKMAQA